jgi:hypothetical protein
MTEELRIRTIGSKTAHIAQEMINIWICWRTPCRPRDDDDDDKAAVMATTF